MSTATTIAARGDTMISQLLFNSISMRLALLVLAASFVLPAAGIGVDLCMFKAMAGLPCPGCGLTRSVTNVSQLHLGAAFGYHPLGPAIWGLVAVLGVANFVGEDRRDRARRWLARHDVVARRVYWGFVYAFVAFGVFRLAGAALVPGWFAGV